MVGPKAGPVTLKVGDREFRLWYSPGAWIALQKEFGIDATNADTQAVARRLDVTTLAEFIWAGSLHELRELSLEEVRDAVDWCYVPLNDLVQGVADAIATSNSGTKPEQGDGKDPTKPTASRSRGKPSSASPSVN